MRCVQPSAMKRVLGLSIFLLASACNHPSASQTPIVDLVVDANRSGLLEPGDPSEEQGKNAWDAQHGAVLLANLDDDDSKGQADASDDVVNGRKDIEDLSPVVVRAWPGAPDDATGVLTVDGAAAQMVHVFRVNGDAGDPASYAKVDPTSIALSAADLESGVQLAVEATDLVSSTQPGAWTGLVQLTLTVTPHAGAAPLTDAAQLRVAPLILQFNTAHTERVFYTDASTDTATLSDGIMKATFDAETQPLELASLGLEVDVWSQDFFDLGWTGKPGPGGKEVGMHVAIRSAQPDRTAGQITTKVFLGPDFGAVEKHGDIGQASSDSYSMNSFGNWDVIPPYTKGTESYPLGRNYWGATSSAGESPDATFQDFYRAQKVQPEINVDTHFLLVGHVDEFSSFVKTNTQRGWGLLLGSPKKARAMLMSMSSTGQGATQMFAGKMQYDNSGNASPAAISIDQVLANADLMAESQIAQMYIDEARAKLQGEIGLADDEITDIPFLFERSYGKALAYQPGTVNLLHVDGKVLIPDPFGPLIGGVDPFKDDLMKRLSALGLEVHFADDWDTFHEGDGEVHCGTNALRDLKLAWWTSGR